jgi:glycosyltransferase involved in cell wall biosynthesis
MYDERPEVPTDRRPAPVVSVVLPTYNRASMLPRAVDSVLEQSFTDWELIVVDDASPENVLGALAPYLEDPRVRVLRRPVNGGVSAARNTGLADATGHFVCFLDSDDEFERGKLAHQVPLLERAPPEVAGVYGAATPVVGQLRGPEPSPAREMSRDRLMRFADWQQIGALLFRREVLGDLGFDESLRAGEDLDLLLRILEGHRVVGDDVPVSVFNSHDGERLSTDTAMVAATQHLYDKYRSEIDGDAQLHAIWHYKLARYYWRLDEVPRARRHLAVSVRARPGDMRRWFLLVTSLSSPRLRRRLVAQYVGLSLLRRRISSLVRGAG